jgi:hypothetical protein
MCVINMRTLFIPQTYPLTCAPQLKRSERGGRLMSGWKRVSIIYDVSKTLDCKAQPKRHYLIHTRYSLHHITQSSCTHTYALRLGRRRRRWKRWLCRLVVENFLMRSNELLDRFFCWDFFLNDRVEVNKIILSKAKYLSKHLDFLNLQIFLKQSCL